MHYRAVGTLAILAVAAVTLSGCTNSSSGGDGGSGTLTVAGLAAGDHEGIQAVADMFTEETGIEVEITEDGSSNYPTTLRTQLGAGTAPDVFFTFPGNGSPAAQQTLAEAGLLADLSDLSFASEIPEAYQGAAQFEGSTYLMPQTQGLIGAIYNQTAMDAASLTAPTTFSEVLQFCADARSAGKSAFAVGMNDNFVTQFIPYALTPTLVYGPDPEFAEKQADGSATFADSGWQETFDLYVEMRDAGCFQENFLGTSFNDSIAQVSRGDAMAIVSVNAIMPQLRDGAAPDTTFAMSPLPATDDPAETYIPASLAAGYAVNAEADNMDAAMDFIELLATPEAQAVYAQNAAGLPVFLSDSFESDPAVTEMLPYLEDERFSPYPDQGWPNPRVQQTHFTVVQQLMAGQTTTQDALAELDRAYAGS